MQQAVTRVTISIRANIAAVEDAAMTMVSRVEPLFSHLSPMYHQSSPDRHLHIGMWPELWVDIAVHIQVTDIWNSTRWEWLDQLQEIKQGQWPRNGITAQNSGPKVGKEGDGDNGEN